MCVCARRRGEFSAAEVVLLHGFCSSRPVVACQSTDLSRQLVFVFHLDVFRTFPGLRELDLSLNGLRNLTVDAGDFVHLEVSAEGSSSLWFLMTSEFSRMQGMSHVH